MSGHYNLRSSPSRNVYNLRSSSSRNVSASTPSHNFTKTQCLKYTVKDLILSGQGDEIRPCERWLTASQNTHFKQTTEQSCNTDLEDPDDSNHSDMNFDDICGARNPPRSKKWFYIAFVGILLSIVWYFNDQINESTGNIKDFKNDLCSVRTDISKFKTGFEKDTQEKIKSIQKDTDKKLQTIESLLEEIKKNQQTQVATQVAGASKTSADQNQDNAKNSEVYQVVQQALEEYSADKTGKIDFALASAGGSILSLGDNTESYNPNGISITLFGIPLCSSAHGPKSLLQAGALPGECWAFRGSQGSVIVRLLGHVYISCVSIEHISKHISPTGEIDSAPKEFSIWGLPCSQNPGEKVSLGDFTYDVNGPPIQYFHIGENTKSYEYIEFKVNSNHGNPVFTCVYRLRVHGVLEKS